MDQNTHQCYDSGSSCPEIEDFLNCLLHPGTAKASPIFVASKIEHPDRRFYQGLAFMQEFEDQEAINSFIKFMQEKPQSVGASFNLAVLYHEDGICEELCCHYFRNALMLARSSSERRVVTLQFADHLLFRNLHQDGSSQERRLDLMRANEAKKILVAALEDLISQAPFDEEWLLNHGGSPRSERIQVAGPIDAIWYNILRFDQAIMSVCLEESDPFDLLKALKNWDKILVYYINPKDNRLMTETHPYGMFYANRYMQRKCILRP